MDDIYIYQYPRLWMDNDTCGLVGVRRDTLVMIPNVPSDPMNSCLISYPVLSFRRVERLSTIVPSAST